MDFLISSKETVFDMHMTKENASLLVMGDYHFTHLLLPIIEEWATIKLKVN